jgi:hypothetical protein
LFDRGLALVPVRPGQKAPWDAGWPKRTFTAKDFAADDNVGVKCGEPSHWLIDTDCDCSEAVACAAALMPETGMVHGRAGRRRAHLWFVVPGAETAKFTDLDNKMLLEIRSNGAQTVIPPSLHESGEAVEWDSDGAPMAMDLADYQRAVRMTAIATLFARHWPAGDRHTAAGHIAGFLARLGFSAHETAKIVGTAARVAGDEEHEDRERVARDTARKHEGGGKTTGTPKLVEALPEGKALVAKVYHWMGRKGDEFLDALNKRHFVAQLGTKPVVGTDDDDDAGVEFSPFDEFKNIYYAQRVGKVRLGEWWSSNHPHSSRIPTTTTSGRGSRRSRTFVNIRICGVPGSSIISAVSSVARTSNTISSSSTFSRSLCNSRASPAASRSCGVATKVPEKVP